VFGGVGWKASRMTSVEAFAAATVPALPTGACVSAVIVSGAIVVPLRIPFTTMRMPGCMSVGAIGMSISLVAPPSCSSSQMNWLVPPAKLSAWRSLRVPSRETFTAAAAGAFRAEGCCCWTMSTPRDA
jgi:hypothetical protein